MRPVITKYYRVRENEFVFELTELSKHNDKNAPSLLSHRGKISLRIRIIPQTVYDTPNYMGLYGNHRTTTCRYESIGYRVSQRICMLSSDVYNQMWCEDVIELKNVFQKT